MCQGGGAGEQQALQLLVLLLLGSNMALRRCLLCAFLATFPCLSFPSSGLYSAVGGALQCPSVVPWAVEVSRCLGCAALLQERGERLTAAYTHLCGCLLGFSMPLGSVQLREDGTLLLPSASVGMLKGGFSLLLLCPL